MNEADLRSTIVAVLCDVAPDIEPDEIDPGADLREETDIDSMDFLNFVVGLHKALGIEIPEGDYRQLVSLDDVVAYVRERLEA